MIFSLLLNRRLLADTRVGTFGASVNRRRRIAEDRSRLLPMGVHQAEETSSVHSMKIKVKKVKLATFTKADIKKDARLWGGESEKRIHLVLLTSSCLSQAMFGEAEPELNCLYKYAAAIEKYPHKQQVGRKGCKERVRTFQGKRRKRLFSWCARVRACVRTYALSYTEGGAGMVYLRGARCTDPVRHSNLAHALCNGIKKKEEKGKRQREHFKGGSE